MFFFRFVIINAVLPAFYFVVLIPEFINKS